MNGWILELADETVYHYRDGIIHHFNGPAIILSDGSQRWYQDNKRHRPVGPAFVNSNGYQSWYRDGEFVTKIIFFPNLAIMFKLNDSIPDGWILNSRDNLISFFYRGNISYVYGRYYFFSGCLSMLIKP